MAAKDSQDGCATVVGGALVGIIVLVSLIPKPVWIGLGIALAVGLLGWLTYAGFSALAKLDKADEERKRVAVAAEASRAEQRRVEAAWKEKRQRVATIGERNAALVESAEASVQTVRKSEAARAGWLGDVDFTADVKGITENFQRAHALRRSPTHDTKGRARAEVAGQV